MISTTNGTFAANVRGRRSIEASRVIRRSRSGTRTTLGALAFRALARALACLVFLGGAGRAPGRGSGRVEALFCGPDRGRESRPGAGAVPGCRRRRRDGGASLGRRGPVRGD